MNHADWNSARSQFNHNWLKNRFLPTVARARQVAVGAVKDPSAWADLSGLFADWPDRRNEARRVLSGCPVTDGVDIEFPCDATPAEIEILRWLSITPTHDFDNAARTREHLSAAQVAIDQLDDAIRTLEKDLLLETPEPSIGDLIGKLDKLASIARCVGEAFARLATAA